MTRSSLYHIPAPAPSSPNAFLPLYVNFLGCNYLQEPIERPNGFGSYQWFYCQKGSGEFILEDQKAIIREGEGFFLPPRTGHSYHALSEDWTLHLIAFSGSCADEITRSCGMTEAGSYRIPDSEIFGQYIQKMLQVLPACEGENILVSSPNSSPSGSQYVRFLRALPEKELYLLSGLCYQFLIELRNKTDRSPVTGLVSRNRVVKEIISYLEDHFSENISLTDLSDHLHLSKEYLCTLFRREIGYTIHQYLTILRIGQSVSLLERYPEMKVSDIARKCGYESPSHFGKQFKASTGMTPEQYRLSRLV